MLERLTRLALVPLLLGMLLVPASAGAQDDGIEFPPVDGQWEGMVNFAGFWSSESARDDGSFNVTVTDVIDDTTILFDLDVDDNGQVTSGKMSVDLTYFDEGVGAEEAFGQLHPFHVVHDHHQTGTLEITGNANRLVAAGTLMHTINTSADGDLVEEVSGTEATQVEWVFHAIESTCVRVTAGLVTASGDSLIRTALTQRDTVDDSRESHNRLGLQLWAWPASVEDPEEIKEALEEISVRTDELRAREIPEASHLLRLVGAWSDLNAKLAALNECQNYRVGWQPQSEESWLVDVLQEALEKATDNDDFYEASELIDLWTAGVQEGVLNGDLLIRFQTSFHAKLSEAIAKNDTATITDILAFASAYDLFPLLYSKAKAALL
jgi:hypothetical protein